jgi:2-hydroxychromene-2-carboxylate isomerase
MRTVTALRMALAVPDEERAALSARLYAAYWVEDRDLADERVLAEIGGAELVARAKTPEAKQALTDATAEAIAAGVCGAPSFVVDGYLFWGQDRLTLVDRVLDGWRPPS